MCKEKNDNQNWYYLSNNRAMVSLGPLNKKKTCPYSCAFCYVQDGFIPYVQKDITDIIDFLIRHRGEYDIIYVSGDTDSFADPRKKTGILLLQRIAENINCDLLFTTRTVFNDEDVSVLSEIVRCLNNKKKELFACISISRYSDEVAYLEPKPIPSPEERIETIKKLHEIGAVTVLALRPFLPVVPISDYLEILKRTAGFVDIVLGEAFYFIIGGQIEKRVFLNEVPEKVLTELKTGYMDFNDNTEEWSIWSSENLEKQISDYCAMNNIVFSMRSNTAISEYKMKKTL